MGQTILTDAQRIVLDLFSNESVLSEVYYLSGGTALAEYYLQHRDSDDLDFFTDEMIDRVLIESFIQKVTAHFGTATARMECIHDRRLFFVDVKTTELKLEFSPYPFPALEERSKQNGVLIDSLRDIRANKLAALIDRFEPKDFVDLYFILQDCPLEEIRGDVEKKFGLKISPLLLGSELAKVKRVEILPRMKRSLTIKELKTFFAKLAKELTPTVFEN